MAVVLLGSENRDDENAEVIHGRPDLDYYANRSGKLFGVTQAKSFPPFVFGVRNPSALVHKVRSVDLHWYRVASMDTLVRLKRPVAIAKTMCGQSFSLRGERARTCRVPRQDALHCGRCHGFGPVFPKSGDRKNACGLTRQEAHVRLGCIANGY